MQENWNSEIKDLIECTFLEAFERTHGPICINCEMGYHEQVDRDETTGARVMKCDCACHEREEN